MTNVFNGIHFEPEISPMRTGKSKSWIGEYHWVIPPVTEKNKYENTTELATEWCQKQFGNSGRRWYENQKKFFFKNEEDMLLFILRWS